MSGLKFNRDAVPETLEEGRIAIVDGVTYVGNASNLPTIFQAEEKFTSYEVGVLPTTVGATEGTIGAYFTDNGLLQKVQFVSGAWTSVGESISTKKYVDDNFLGENITVTVGNNGDYSTINDALENLGKKYPFFKKDGYTAKILLLSGFVMNEQVLIKSLDLSWIIIESEDATVSITRSALTQRFGEEPSNAATELNWETTPHMDNFPAFGVDFGGFLPIINCLFDMDDSGDWQGRTAFSATNNSKLIIKPYAGCINAGDNGLYVTQRSEAVAVRSIFDNAGRDLTPANATSKNKLTGVCCFRNSCITMRGASVKNASNDGMYMGSASTVDALNADFSNAGRRGIWIYGAAVLQADAVQATNCGTDGLHVIGGATVSVEIDGGIKANFSNAGQHGIYCIAGRISADEFVANDTGDTAVFIQEGGVVNADSCEIVNAGAFAVDVYFGGVFNARAATITDPSTKYIRCRFASKANILNGILTKTVGTGLVEVGGGSEINIIGTGLTASNTNLSSLNAIQSNLGIIYGGSL